MNLDGTIAKGNEANKNAVKLTDEQVYKLRMHKLENWPSLSEVWALRHGVYGLAVANMVANTLINLTVRKRFRLHVSGSIVSNVASTLMVCVIPPVVSAGVIGVTFQEKLMKSTRAKLLDECAVCSELKTTLIYLGIGTFWPAAISWSINFTYAGIYQSYKVPSIDVLADRRNWPLFWRKVKSTFAETTRNTYGPFAIIVAAQLLLCSFVLYMQQEQFRNAIEPSKFTRQEINKLKFET